MDDKAQEIADAILANLNGRRGIRQAFDEVDDEILAEIRETIAQIIRDRL